jgi:hypothetical protein
MSLTAVAVWLWVVVALAAAALAFVGGRSRYGWLLGSLAMLLALPRALTYEAAFLLVGLAKRPDLTEPN